MPSASLHKNRDTSDGWTLTHHKRRQNLPLGVRLSEELDPTALQVLNFYVAPLLFEVLSDKPSMAVMGGRFTAKQTCAV